MFENNMFVYFILKSVNNDYHLNPEAVTVEEWGNPNLEKE